MLHNFLLCRPPSDTPRLKLLVLLLRKPGSRGWLWQMTDWSSLLKFHSPSACPGA